MNSRSRSTTLERKASFSRRILSRRAALSGRSGSGSCAFVVFEEEVVDEVDEGVALEEARRAESCLDRRFTLRSFSASKAFSSSAVGTQCQPCSRCSDLLVPCAP